MDLTRELVQRSQDAPDVWRLGNQVLYDLCRDHPRHDDAVEVVAKVWLIGRAYSASIERGRGVAVGPGVDNDRFYAEHVTKALRESQLDNRLRMLENMSDLDDSSIGHVLETHGHLVQCFEMLTTKGKRSLASKYLHFHRPDLFFIFDSRAVSSIRRLGVDSQSIQPPASADRQYAKFVGAALGLRRYVSTHFGQRLSPRQLDRLLLAVFASGNNWAANQPEPFEG